jgi:predicted RNase H-like HicB family nuclease
MPSEGWYIAYCEEVPSANGQGKTKEEALESLASAIELLFDCYRDDLRCELLPGAEQTTVEVG